jgi:DNA repair protein RadD
LITLRPYQAEQIERTRAALRIHDAVMLQLPTGGGKTAMAAFMSGSAREKHKSVWFLAHRDFLLEQTAATFDLVGIPYGFIAAGRPFNRYQAVQICSVGTLVRRLGRLHVPDVIIWDEAHHCSAATYAKIYEWATVSRLPGLQPTRHIGLSATPCRLDGKGLGKYFKALVCGPNVGELIETGYLSRYKAFAPSTPDLQGIGVRAGDYARDEIDLLMDTGQIVGELVRHYQEYADGLRALYFAVSIRHSEHIAATFNAAGIPAVHLDGTHSTAERIAAARAFGRGDIRIIANVDLFGEGYDLASQAGMDVAVEAVGLARPTQSLALHLQQVGRALRVAPHKDHAVILDHAGNLMRHGLPDDEREWSLEGVDKRRKKSGPNLAVRQCRECFGVYRAGLEACPYCGTVPEIQAREVEEIAGELQEINQAAARKARPVDLDRARARDVDALTALAASRGYKNPVKWAAKVHEARARKRADIGQMIAEQRAAQFRMEV